MNFSCPFLSTIGCMKMVVSECGYFWDAYFTFSNRLNQYTDIKPIWLFFKRARADLRNFANEAIR